MTWIGHGAKWLKSYGSEIKMVNICWSHADTGQWLSERRFTLQWRIQDFPKGGRAPVGGGVDLRCGHFSEKMYAKMKELGPIWGRAGLDPPIH